MLNLKKTAVAVAVLALGSSAAFAGTMGPVCTPGSVTVPCEHSAWDFGGKALYLQSTGDDYITAATAPGVVAAFDDFDHEWGWGFQLEGSYHFGTGNDINLNWYHYSKTTTRTFDPSLLGGLAFTTSIEPKWDAVNLEVGQHVDFGEQQNIRFHAGAQYAHIERDFSTMVALTGLTTFAGETKFNGFGPRMGVDMSYDLGNGFGVYGKGATAILVGDAKFNDTFTASALGFSNTRTHIVPELEARLGVNYTYAMPAGDFSLDAAYTWVNYFDALHNPLSASGVTSMLGRTDFALHGVEFGAKWVGNVA